MNRLPLIISAGAVAAAAAVTPAVIGLTGNPSFSQQVPVRVPAHASVVTFPTTTRSPDARERHDHRGGAGRRHRDDTNQPQGEPVGTPSTSARVHEPEPGDDRLGGRGGSSGRRDSGSGSSQRSDAARGHDRDRVEGGRRGRHDG